LALETILNMMGWVVGGAFLLTMGAGVLWLFLVWVFDVNSWLERKWTQNLADMAALAERMEQLKPPKEAP
jgi:hypothetical protein